MHSLIMQSHIHCISHLLVMVSLRVEAGSTLSMKTLGPLSRDLYTLYEIPRSPGFSSGGSQVILIESSVLATTRRFVGGEGGTATIIMMICKVVQQVVNCIV